jgi:hypothetical protein
MLTSKATWRPTCVAAAIAAMTPVAAIPNAAWAEDAGSEDVTAPADGAAGAGTVDVDAADDAEPEGAKGSSPHVVADERPGTPHLRLDTSAVYGIGGQSFLGVLARSVLGVTAWDDGNATGSGDFGLALAYHNEPTFLAPWLASGGIEGAAHRVQLLVVAGHTFHMLDDRALSLALHAQFGWNRWISSYTLDYPAEDVRGEATVERTHFVVGAQLTLAWRVADYVGLNLVLGGPFPIYSSYVISMFHVGAGLTFYVL